MTIHLQQTLKAAIHTELYPRSQIDVYIEVLQVIKKRKEKEIEIFNYKFKLFDRLMEVITVLQLMLLLLH